jgi:transcriptional regulator GlxA family with amidase domain
MKRRRLHAVRQALLSTPQHETSVSLVAVDHGFFELGRFAVDYRRLFDESPSATLAREMP